MPFSQGDQLASDHLLQAPKIGVSNAKALQLVDGLKKIFRTGSPVADGRAQHGRDLWVVSHPAKLRPLRSAANTMARTEFWPAFASTQRGGVFGGLTVISRRHSLRRLPTTSGPGIRYKVPRQLPPGLSDIIRPGCSGVPRNRVTLYGWVTTCDGAMVVGEPDGSMTWYPVSDHPTDKATYDFEITVPEGKVAVANGLPAGGPITEDGWTTWSGRPGRPGQLSDDGFGR